MTTLKYRAKSPEVYTLCELLHKLGYEIKISDSFTLEIDTAIKDFQKKNSLVMDGIVGMKTWQVLFDQSKNIFESNNLFLSETDLKNFAQKYALELATVKAVNEIESSGKGFLMNGKPKILFEGHVFWSQLKARGIKPESLLNAANKNVLYPKWTKIYYLGGVKEYDRLNEAIAINSDAKIKEAALASASWGSFQIMGYHATDLGYTSVQDFVNHMNLHEREHLMAFGKFLEKNNIIPFLKNKNWSKFAEKYNGAGYRSNKYDEKLQKSYLKYC